jgi:hypothetical protein
VPAPVQDLIRRRWPLLSVERAARLARALRDGQLVELRGGDPSGRGAWVHVKEYECARPPRHQLTEKDLEERVAVYPDRTDQCRRVYRNPAYEIPSETRAAAEAAMRLRERRGQTKPATSAGQEIR